MKVYISNYRHHWLSPYTVLEKVLCWKDWENISYDTPWVEKWADRLEPICRGVQWVLDCIHPRIDYVKIDRWDTWSMDHTLSHIILPMLQQLQATKHGSPNVADEDVPEYLRSHMAQPREYEWDTDSLHHQRWDWVLAEMIWSFSQVLDTDSEDKFFDHSEVKDRKHDIFGQIHSIKIDHEGLNAHQARMTNGFRLFGRYYQALWD
jgi:hypothetical protein